MGLTFRPLNQYDGAMNDPIAFFLTISTYGTWLPGDERGWVEYQHGWKLPCPPLELEARAKMSEDACVMTPIQQNIVESQLIETCKHRNWVLHARQLPLQPHARRCRRIR